MPCLHPCPSPPHAGTLDLKELEDAFVALCGEAHAWKVKQAQDITKLQVEQLIERAQLIEQAAEAAEEADAREEELVELDRSLASSADVRFGELLYKRKIKPGEPKH